MIYGCVIGYDEPLSNLKRCLESLRDAVDVIVFVDGAYKEFPYAEHPWSTEEQMAFVHEYADVVITRKTPWEDEIQKRNAYLIGRTGDRYLVMDCDEELIGVPQFEEGVPYYEVDIHRDNLPIMTIFRSFAHTEGIHYAGTHHSLFWQGVFLNKMEGRPVLQGCHFEHYTSERPQDRVQRKGIYYRSLQESEREFRSMHNV